MVFLVVVGVQAKYLPPKGYQYAKRSVRSKTPIPEHTKSVGKADWD
jgi:hypothetical protein